MFITFYPSDYHRDRDHKFIVACEESLKTRKQRQGTKDT